MLNVLIADDARDVAETIAFGARMNWPDCQTTIAANGREALHYFEANWFDLVVLDVAMPPPNGFEVCRRIREGSQVPILMLTVLDGTMDKVRALDLGADDYLTKPFEHLELLARMRSLVRRLNLVSPVSRADFSCGDLSVNRTSQEVRVGDKSIELTPIEYNLLNELISHAGSVLPHEFLLRRIWGREYEHESHYLKEYIHRLRHKLGDDAESPRFIETERGAGYRFVPCPQ